MDKISFDDAVNKIYRYYGWDLPTKDRLDMSFRIVENIPTSAIDYIVDSYFREFNFPPHNIGKTFHNFYLRWGQSLYRKKNDFYPTPCPDCGGEGLLRIYPTDLNSGKKYRKLCTCAACENWRQYGVRFAPSHFRADLEQRGIQVDPPVKNNFKKG